MEFFSELKRRNLHRIAIAYTVLAWLVIEVTATIATPLGLPDWTLQAVIWIGIIGFPVAAIFCWNYELTPQGLVRDDGHDRSRPHAYSVHKINAIITLLLCLVLAFILLENYVSTKLPANSPAVVEPKTSA